jgi:hypothetical protein
MPRSRKNLRKEERAALIGGDALTPAQKRAQAEFDRRRDQEHRYLCNTFQFWSVCAESPCRRRKSCVGDADACFERRWWLVPEKIKIFFRAGIKARIAGLSVEEACRVADEEVARSADHIARVDAETRARLDAKKAAQHGK